MKISVTEQQLTPIVIFLILLLSFIPGITSQDNPPRLNSCLDKCVLSSRYWLDNGATSKLHTMDRNEIKLWPTKCAEGNGISEFNYIFNKTTTWGTLMQSKVHNVCVNFAKQYISIRLNLCRGTCVNKVIFDGLIDAYDILETQCTESGLMRQRNTTKTNKMAYLEQLFTVYNTGESINEKCGINTRLDCNNNGVLDSCELNHDHYIGICNARQVHMTSILDMCSIYKNLTAQEVCNILNRDVERDCDGNFILDSCQISRWKVLHTHTLIPQMENPDPLGSMDDMEVPMIYNDYPPDDTNSLECASIRCRGFTSQYDFPKSCISCNSEDLDDNGIPDSCQDFEYMVNGFSKLSPITNILNDCNSDGIDDEYSIHIEIVTDVNENGVPDDCEFGSCCNEGVCFMTTVDGCLNTTFSRGILCSERDDCFIPDTSLDVGSCCRRTSGVNTYLICEDSIMRGNCNRMSGFWDDDPCEVRNCAQSLGSCCYDYDTNVSLCYKKVSLEVCSGMDSKRFIFDKRDCLDEGSLCNGNLTKLGTCIQYDKCIEDITVTDCEQISGIFDNLPCEFRLDIYNNTIGSCCTRDGGCLDLVSMYKCMSINGTFSTDSCALKNFCKERVATNCCVNNDGYCLPMISDGCSNMMGNFTPVNCDDLTMCNLVQHIGDGCCIVKKRCLKSIENERCLFFNGTYIDNIGCLTNMMCFDNIFNFDMSTKSPSNAIITVTNGNANNVIAINETKPGQVVPVTLFSITMVMLLGLFIFYSALILHRRPRSTNEAENTLY